MIKELELELEELERKVKQYGQKPRSIAAVKAKKELQKAQKNYLLQFENLTPADKVYLARKKERPGIYDYINAIFEDFFEQRGDRLASDDKSITGGIAMYKGVAVTVIGHNKGKTLEENIACRFGMPGPDGYRKAMRLMEQAQKFGRPIITFVDTPGAYPGIEAEERGQGEAIARSLTVMGRLTVPVISVVTGEGGSGGALALSVANKMLMLENSVYAILSPEGFASILWKDSSKSEQASELMRLTAEDLYTFGIADEIIAEGAGGAHTNPKQVFAAVDEALHRNLKQLMFLGGEELAETRRQKFRQIGSSL